MSNCATMAKVIFFKIDGLSKMSKEKDRYQYSHDMFQACLRKDMA